MDLIYTDKNKIDLGVFMDYSLDLAYGSGENDFELTVNTDNNVCKEDYLIYSEDTDYGGVIDSIEVDTSSQVVKYKGRTWQGMLDKKIISPDAGQDYYIVSGDANTIIGQLITRLSLGAIFKANTDSSKNISSYQFERYITAYEGIYKMLSSVGYKLKMKYTGGKVELSAVPIGVYDADDGLDTDRIQFDISKTYNPVNHLICLGGGELKDRTVVHLYLDATGNVSTIQHYLGINEITEVYDYSGAESVADLTAKGKEQLLKQDTNSVDVTLGEGYSFDIGDKLTVTDTITGIEVTRIVTKKIVKITDNIVKVSYKVGE